MNQPVPSEDKQISRQAAERWVSRLLAQPETVVDLAGDRPPEHRYPPWWLCPPGWYSVTPVNPKELVESCLLRMFAVVAATGGVQQSDLITQMEREFPSKAVRDAYSRLLRRNDIEECRGTKGYNFKRSRIVRVTKTVRGCCRYCGELTSSASRLIVPRGFEVLDGIDVDRAAPGSIPKLLRHFATGSLFRDCRRAWPQAGDESNAEHCSDICEQLDEWWGQLPEVQDDQRRMEVEEHVKCLREQVRAVKRWLKSRDPEVFRSLPPGYGPLRTSP